MALLGQNIDSRFLCNIVFYSIRLYFHHQTHPQQHQFHFGPSTSFFLELLVIALHSSPVACWTPSDLGDSSFSVLSFCLFILFMGFSRQEYWSGLPFLPPVDHVLSELFTMTHPSWVTLHGMAYSFIELCKHLHHHKAVLHEGIPNQPILKEINPEHHWKDKCLV